MIISRTRTYDAYHFGLSLDLSNQQLKQLISVFNSPTDTVNSTLGGRTSITVMQLEGIGSVVIKHYRRGGAIRYLIKQRYLKCGKTRCQIEYELLQQVKTMGINAPVPIAFAYRGHLLYQCWLVTQEVKYHLTVAHISRSNEDRARIVMNEVVNQVSKLIKNKILHVDLHPGNVIVDSQNKVYLLDFDKGCMFFGRKNSLRDRYLRRWDRAVQKYRLPKILSQKMHSGLSKNYEK